MALVGGGNGLVIAGLGSLVGSLVLVQDAGRHGIFLIECPVAAEVGTGQIQLSGCGIDLGICLGSLLLHIPGVNGHKHISGMNLISCLDIPLENAASHLEGHIGFVAALNGARVAAISTPGSKRHCLCLYQRILFLCCIFAAAAR